MSNAREVLNDVAKLCADHAREKGWSEESDAIAEVRKLIETDSAHPAVEDLFRKFVNRQTIRDVPVLTKLLLIASEVSEAMEDARKAPYASDGIPRGFPEELADILIRVLELSGSLGIDIGDAVMKKIEANTGRQYRHGSKRF